MVVPVGPSHQPMVCPCPGTKLSQWQSVKFFSRGNRQYSHVCFTLLTVFPAPSLCLSNSYIFHTSPHHSHNILTQSSPFSHPPHHFHTSPQHSHTRTNHSHTSPLTMTQTAITLTAAPVTWLIPSCHPGSQEIPTIALHTLTLYGPIVFLHSFKGLSANCWLEILH